MKIITFKKVYYLLSMKLIAVNFLWNLFHLIKLIILQLKKNIAALSIDISQHWH